VGLGSGTAALTVMLLAAGIEPGDEVIVPAHTFLATALAVVHAGASPVCVDVDPGTGLIDPEAVRAAIGPRTASLIPVHLYGQVCPMDELNAVASRAGVAVFEDAAQAHGATYGSRRVGSLGRAAAFSFYPSKNLGALGDAGAICTDDAQLARTARSLRDLGRSNGQHTLAGYNERLDALQAAFLSLKLNHLDSWNQQRRAHALAYRDRLGGCVEMPAQALGGSPVYHLFAVRSQDRDALAAALQARGIATGIHYPRALPDQPALPALHGTETPVARDWAARELSLPMFPELTDGEIDAVCEAVVTATEPPPPGRP
ncbi:MAG TPA: DegT/DnrJ/EryC1/StrS family aminotransferase, partial [Solirubrobacteraceae bacterium]|nr:DegT/DnrJ/EryC1/StrS family aminotransferase [Solirubrobacteraceae bacterium]